MGHQFKNLQHEIYKIITIKDQSLFFGIIFHSEVLYFKSFEKYMLFGNLHNSSKSSSLYMAQVLALQA